MKQLALILALVFLFFGVALADDLDLRVELLNEKVLRLQAELTVMQLQFASKRELLEVTQTMLIATIKEKGAKEAKKLEDDGGAE